MRTNTTLEPSSVFCMLICEIFIRKSTAISKLIFTILGFSIIAKAYKAIPGSLSSCSSDLKEDNLLAISPGGVYEALFSDSSYKLLWNNRLGFAKVALHAKVVSLNIVYYSFLWFTNRGNDKAPTYPLGCRAHKDLSSTASLLGNNEIQKYFVSRQNAMQN